MNIYSCKLKNDELVRISIKDFKSAKKTSIIIVLDNVRSAMNVGSIFRTADHVFCFNQCWHFVLSH